MYNDADMTVNITPTAGKILRFAPSPTGSMHLGNCRTALVNYYSCKCSKDDFFIRIDDTDADRDREEYEKHIFQDLDWLGINYKTIIKQSNREEIYEEYLQKLITEKKVYECFETEEELDEGHIYNRKALFLSEDEKTHFRKTRKSYWRFLMSKDYYEFKDGVMGIIKTKRCWSDPVIKRPKDTKAFTYNFTSAIDDMLMGVTDIIRGQEHINNAIIQQEIISCFGNHKINFFHLPVIITADGQKLSKRLGDLSIQTLRQEGYHPASIISMCLSLGTNKPPLINSDLQELKNYFNIKNFSRSSPKFEKKTLQNLNTKILRQLKPAEITSLGFKQDIWNIIVNNISSLNEYYKWEKILNYSELYEEFNFKDLLKSIYKGGILNFQEIDNIDLRKNFLINLHKSLTGESAGPEICKILNYKLKSPLIRFELLGK
jgi:glutamyl-tRNA synthetase